MSSNSTAMTWLLGGMLAFTGATAGSASAQTLGLATGPEVSWWRVIGALVFCCLLGAAGALALRYRLQGRRPAAARINPQTLSQLFAGLDFRRRPADAAAVRLRVIETVRLGYQVEVSLLECDGEGVMIVTSPHGAFVVNRDAPVKSGDAS